MPIYEYECLSKGHRFEELQKVGSRPVRVCRQCGGKVKKLVSAAAFHLKGSGWYKTDYAPQKNMKSGKSAKDTASKSEAPACETPAACKTECANQSKKGTSA